MTINWLTLGIQTVNVVVLIWLLQRFFWRPVAGMIEQRRAAAQQALTDAEAKRAEAASALAEIERTRAGFSVERDAILAEAHKAADAAGAVRLEQAAKEASSMKIAATAAIEKQKEEADRSWAERSGQLAANIAARLAARLDGPAVRTAFLDWLVKAIRALPEPARQAVAAQGAALEAISATDLDATEQAHATALIREAFGGNSRVDYKTDPALIAGLELHAPHLVVSNSWRADITEIMADLAHAQRH